MALSMPDACPLPSGPATPSPAGRASPTAGRRSSSPAQGSARRQRPELQERSTAAELPGDCVGLATPPPKALAGTCGPRSELSGPRPPRLPHLCPQGRLPCSFKLVMSCSCFSSSELFILAGGAEDKRQGGRGEGDTGEGEQKARRRWRGVRRHYPEVGMAPAPPAPPPPGAQHAVRSSRAPTLGPRLLHLRRAGLGAGPGRGVGREGGSGVPAPGRL